MVLGAGASLASGIPLGSDLVDRWLKELHLREDKEKIPLEEWATAKNLGIKGFKYEDRSSFYPKIYERRFRQYPDEGYADLESAMADADPSPGYSILAAALAGSLPERPPRHNAVITTNFDNLVADALSIYTDTFPFVCGHESLAPFVKVAMRRPVVCKIHRDLLTAPQNDPRSLKRLHDAWGTALRSLFEHYTPLFIGYGGNDDTLMDLLESLEPGEIKGQMIWCYHEGSEPTQRIRDVVADHNGILVPVPDFDLLMVLLGEKMGIGIMDQDIGRRANLRTKRYRDRIQALDTVGHPEVTKALVATLDRSGGWWAWYQKAKSEIDNERKEVVFRQGIQHCPESAELYNVFAVFLMDARMKMDEVEELFQKSLDLDPHNPAITANYGEFFLLEGRFEEATQKLTEAKKLIEEQDIEVEVGINLYLAILASLTDEESTQVLRELSRCLSHEFDRTVWNFGNVLDYAHEKLSLDDHALFSAIAMASTDEEAVPAALALIDERLATPKSSAKAKLKRRKSPPKKRAAKTASAKRSKSGKPRRKKGT